MRRVALAATAMLATTCSVQLGDLLPYPCAADGRCGTGFVCDSSRTCIAQPAGAVGSPCAPDCTGSSFQLFCDEETCTANCASASDCPAGSLCVNEIGGAGGHSGGGRCRADCTQNGACDPSLNCTAVEAAGKKVCAPPGSSFPHCETVTGQAACGSCGATLPCGNGSGDAGRCSVSAQCMQGSCKCDNFKRPYACDGGEWAGDGEFFCGATESSTATCTSNAQGFSATCKCLSGRTLKQQCGSSETCEALCANECDTGLQDCPSSTDRCTLVIEAKSVISQSARCLPPGPRGEGDHCMGVMNSDGTAADDCGRGLLCTAEETCARLCTSDADCGASASCRKTVSRLDATRTVCAPTPDAGAACEALIPFQCPQQESCAIFPDADGGTVDRCKPDGSGRRGESCQTDSECQEFLICAGMMQCAALCDTRDRCPGGSTCNRFGGDVGVCL